MSNAAYFNQVFNRTSFTGMTNPLSPVSTQDNILSEAQFRAKVDTALKGLAPLEVYNTPLSGGFVEQQTNRLGRYLEYWRYYYGRQFNAPYDDIQLKKPENYCSLVAEKTALWTLGESLRLTSPGGNEFIAERLNQILNTAQGYLEFFRAALFSEVTGDAFLYVTMLTRDPITQVPLAKKDQRLLIRALNPSYCYPIYSPNSDSEMAACVIQYPVRNGRDEFMHTMVIEPNTVTQYRNDVQVAKAKNPLGRLNIVHFTAERTNSVFGNSGLANVTPMQDRVNEVLEAIRRVITYHGEPNTYVFGARVEQITKSSDTLLSGLPPEARIETPGIPSNLGELSTMHQRYKVSLANMAQMPLFMLDMEERMKISNTSGLALQLMYQPIIEKSKLRRLTFDPAVLQVADLAIDLLEKYKGEDFKTEADRPEEYRTFSLEHESMLPKDRQLELDLVTKMIEAKLISTAEGMRRVAKVADVERAVLEIAADERYEVVKQYEMQKANTGITPNMSFAFLSSHALSENLDSVAKEVTFQDALPNLAKEVGQVKEPEPKQTE